MTARHIPRNLPGGKYEIVYACRNEPDVEAVLLIPDDEDLLEPLNRGAITVARAIKIVAWRRQLECEMAETERQERDANVWRGHSE